MLKVTKEQIRDAARLYLRTDNYARFTLLPAEAAKAAEAKPVP
jgi:predicted Zn-dependent peptidase